MANEVLKIKKLKKVIGKRTIVSDISIELKKGEIFGFYMSGWIILRCSLKYMKV